MKISNHEIAFGDRSIYIRDLDTIVISDLHLGRNVQLQPFPKTEHEYIKERIESVIDNFDPQTVILNGDVVNQGTHMEADQNILDFIASKSADLVLTRGNHEDFRDGYPERISKNYNIKDQVKIDNILFHHGHRTPTKKSELHIIGHTHPCKNGKPVALYGDNSYYNSNVIILPAFTGLSSGADINSVSCNNNHTPILTDGEDIGEYEVLKEFPIIDYS